MLAPDEKEELMGKKSRLLGGAVGTLALIAGTLISSVPAGAGGSPGTYTIGVDAANLSGHNFEYVDYFPRGQVLPTDPQAVVGNGAVLHFQYQGGLDGLHTATLIPTGESPSQAWASRPTVIFDGDNGEAHPILNPDAAFPTPGCGSADQPCSYDGTNTVNSGALPAFAGTDFYVRINLSASTPTTIHYVCLIHQGMQGSIKVVPGTGSSQSAFASNAASQYAADTAGALSAEAAATAAAANGNFVVAGTATQFVEVAEMLPQTFTVAAGQQVTWNTLTIHDPHTVTFPQGPGSDGVDPLAPPYAPAGCEGVPDTAPDTPLAGPPPGFGCVSPSFPELGVNPAPNGVSTILDATTIATSGIISSPLSGFPSSFTYSFPNAGTYHYQCRIHDHMVGTIVVSG
jgi:plastocyanin